MGTAERVAGWLEGLDFNGADDGVSELGDEPQEKEVKFEPATPPPRRVSLPEALEDISPTDTSFSGCRIFDSPLHKKELSGSLSSGVKIRDDTSDITSIDGNELDLGHKKEQDTSRNATIGHQQPGTLQPASLASYDPPSDATRDVEDETGAITRPTPQLFPPPRNPDQPRMVWVTSCLQCTLANLPCSRTTPACSRCTRNGQADTCLLHRRWFPEEMERLRNTHFNLPILLKLKNEDEKIRRRKVEVAEELYGKWMEAQDRKNWVLPDMHCPRGGYPAVGRGVRVLHPGEGRQQMARVELYVDLEI